MAGYSQTPLWKKLGYTNGLLACAEGAPQDYLPLLNFPSDLSVQWQKRAKPGIAFVHLFTTAKTKLDSRLKALRKLIHPAGVIWVSWPKKSSGQPTDLTEDEVRKLALPLGLVDIKVCAVDDTWSGLKLVVRKELR